MLITNLKVNNKNSFKLRFCCFLFSFCCSVLVFSLSSSSGLDALYDKMLQDRGDVIAVINGERPLSSHICVTHFSSHVTHSHHWGFGHCYCRVEIPFWITSGIQYKSGKNSTYCNRYEDLISRTSLVFERRLFRKKG